MAAPLNRFQRGFTLVELLIVVIILAILAAIVVPQFASSTDDAKDSALDSTLANVRAAVDLYYQQHGEYPAAKAAGPAPLCSSTAGGGAAFSNTAFLEQLSMYTDADGLACSAKDDTSFKYGPYLKKGTLPNNPITDDNALVVVPDASDGDLDMDGNVAAAGWKFDATTGKFIADDHQNQDPNLQFYDTH